MELQTFTLSNGIRIVHQHTHAQVSHLGIMIHTGSRDESLDQHGMAHFVEHTIFKGTSKRKAYHILSRLENIGGELNAFTSKEETCIYASFLPKYYSRSMELFADITQNSLFPENEIAKERDIVIDEINSYRDSPQEEIFDEFEDIIYEGHPLGRNILGSIDSVKKMDRRAIFRFVKENYHPEQMVIISIGNISMQKLIRISEQYFRDIKAQRSPKPRLPFANYKVATKREEKSLHQAHSIIGNQAYGLTDHKRLALTLLNNVLGGPGLNTRLNMGIREKYGFCYNIESNYTTYTETGAISIYMGTDLKYLNRTQDLVLKELKKLREKKLGSLQLKRAKQQLLGQNAIAEESSINRMMAYGKSMLIWDKIDSNDIFEEKILNIKAEEVLEAANEIFDPKQLTELTYLSKP